MVSKMASENIEVNLSCRTMGISRSGYYGWMDRPASDRAQENEQLLSEMRRIHAESRGTYGLPRIQAKLKQLGTSCGKNRIQSLMKKGGICGFIPKRFKVRTTDSSHNLPIAPRIFKTEEVNTHPSRANEVWASDISYIPTREGFVFLGVYLDLFTRKVVGLSIADHMGTDLILSALEMALGRQPLVEGSQLLVHSDRGSQYASEAYRKRLTSLGITASMSRKGNCYDNAFAESFFCTLKKELTFRTEYKNKEEAKKAIFEYIEVLYNRKRIHSSIGCMTPVQFEESLVA